ATCLLLLSTMVPSSSCFYTLSLHDALPIYSRRVLRRGAGRHRASADGGARRQGNRARHQRRDRERADQTGDARNRTGHQRPVVQDRKSTRLNSSHVKISYAVFCLKKKKSRT